MIHRNDTFRNAFSTIFLEKQGGFDAAEKVSGKESVEKSENKPYERARAAIPHRNAVEQNISKFLKDQGIDGKDAHAAMEKAKGSMPVTETVQKSQNAVSDILKKKIAPSTIEELQNAYQCEVDFFQTGKANNKQTETKLQTDASVGLLVPIADLDSRTTERDVESAADPGNLIARITPRIGVPFDLDMGSVRGWDWNDATTMQKVLSKIAEEMDKRASVAALTVPSKRSPQAIPADSPPKEVRKPNDTGRAKVPEPTTSTKPTTASQAKQSVAESNNKSAQA